MSPRAKSGISGIQTKDYQPLKPESSCSTPVALSPRHMLESPGELPQTFQCPNLIARDSDLIGLGWARACGLFKSSLGKYSGQLVLTVSVSVPYTATKVLRISGNIN